MGQLTDMSPVDRFATFHQKGIDGQVLGDRQVTKQRKILIDHLNTVVNGFYRIEFADRLPSIRISPSSGV